MKVTSQSLAGLVKVLAICIMTCNINAQSTKPHIVFIMVDDLGHGDVGYKGSNIQTPNIDELANNGVRLNRYYVAPSCGPTRSQFLSGRYNIHTGLYGSNLPKCTKEALPTSHKTIANVLKEQGYATHIVGKWHQGYHTVDHLPTNRGFDTFRGFLLSHGDHYTHTTSNSLDYRNNLDPYPNHNNEYSTSAFTNRAMELIDAHNTNDPMFLYLSYQAPHTPTEVPQQFVDAYDGIIPDGTRKIYAGMVSAVDAGIGQVVQSLKDNGLYDDTIIIFSSDNGGAVNNGASNWPLRGQKGSYFEGGIKGVGVVSSPLIAADKRNRDVSDLVHITDWMPTVLNIANSTISGPGFTIDGINQWATISTGAASARTEVLHTIKEQAAAGATRFPGTVEAALVTSDGWKIITGKQASNNVYPNPVTNYNDYLAALSLRDSSNGLRIFDLNTDATESTDLSGSNRSKKNELRARLFAHQANMVAKISDDANNNKPACLPSNTGGVWGPWL